MQTTACGIGCMLRLPDGGRSPKVAGGVAPVQSHHARETGLPQLLNTLNLQEVF
jgi:hypothetical protein